MKTRATLRQFLEMLQSLPDEVKDKPIYLIDIFEPNEKCIAMMKADLERDDRQAIDLC